MASASMGHLVVGEFVGRNGGRYVLLANGDYATPFKGEVAFSSAVGALAEVSKKPAGELAWRNLPPERRLQQTLSPGDGCLYRIK